MRTCVLFWVALALYAAEAPAQPFELLVYPKSPLIMPYLKKCSAITIINGGPKDIPGAAFLLDASDSGFKWRGTVYNQAGDQLAEFKGGPRTAPFVQQICHFFEGLRGAQNDQHP